MLIERLCPGRASNAASKKYYKLLLMTVILSSYQSGLKRYIFIGSIIYAIGVSAAKSGGGIVSPFGIDRTPMDAAKPMWVYCRQLTTVRAGMNGSKIQTRSIPGL